MTKRYIYKCAGDVLKDVRKEIFPSQAALAKILGVSQSYISKVETGRKKMDIVELMDYCRALNMSVTEYAAKVEYTIYNKMPEEKRLKKYKKGFLGEILAVFRSFNLT